MIIDKFKNFFTKEDNVLTVKTKYSSTFEFAEIELAKKSYPKWFKDMPGKIDDYFPYPSKNDDFKSFKKPISTVKSCPAIQGIFQTGVIIKAWCDITVIVSPEGVIECEYADRRLHDRPPGSSHPYAQRPGFLKGYAHWKLHSPWSFSTKKLRKFLWTGAYWYNPYLIENNIHIVPGIIDYYTQTGTEINMLLPIKSDSYKLELKFGDPLIHLIPLDDKPIRITKQILDYKEFHDQSNPHLKFIGSSGILKSRNKN